MIPEDKQNFGKISGWRTFLLLGLVLFLAYSNTLQAPWHFDDYNNIVANPKVHAEHPNSSHIAAPLTSLFEDGYSKRPLAYTTFALNWYLGKKDTIGYHIVNIAIHILAAYFLFLTIRTLYQTPRLVQKHSRKQVVFISLLAAALWALNPIQTQAVTYIVQRMASMCGLFYILCIYLYLNARLLKVRTQKSVLLYGACLLSFVAAFLSKENAALLPATLLLIEAVFFQNLRSKKVRMTFFGIGLGLGLAIFITGMILYYNGNPLGLIKADHRLFTPFERLLTQHRILLFYLTLIFYPSPDRLSIVHDITVSKSLWYPWTTLPSIIVVYALIALGIVKIRKWPILCFAILFFFINHLIESSIIPLELIFEHRNYLPSMFLFWPIAVGLVQLIGFYRRKNKAVYCGLVAFIPLLLVGIGTGTFVRNIDWTSAKYLWEDAMQKAPRISRPNHNLAWSHYEHIGDHDTALALYQRALKLKYNNTSQEAMIWNNIAAIYHARGDYLQAARAWEKCQKSAPQMIKPRYRLALSLTSINKLDEALHQLDDIILQKPDYYKALNLKGVILLMQRNPHDALPFFQRSLAIRPLNKRLLINMGACFHMLGDYRKAHLYFNESIRQTRQNRIGLLWRITNSLETGATKLVDADVKEFLAGESIADLTGWLQSCYKRKIVKNMIIVPQRDKRLIERILSQYLSDIDQIRKPHVLGQDLPATLEKEIRISKSEFQTIH